MSQPGDIETAATRARYSRIPFSCGSMETLPEIGYQSWRERFWEALRQDLIPGGRLLEVGVGTGENIPYWPREARIIAIDIAPDIVNQARRRAEQLSLEAMIQEGDAQSIEFPENSFDAAAATFVFCSVPDPVLGMRELVRVVRPGGIVLLMEHVRSENLLLGRLMDLLSPIVLRLKGSNINRETVENVVQSGLHVDKVQELGKGGIFKIIHARVPIVI